MKDEFHFSSPFGIIGKLTNFLFLEKYMTNFLKAKNVLLKEVAEAESKNTP